MIDLKVDAKLPKNEKKGVKEDKLASLVVKFPDLDKDPAEALKEAIGAYGAKAILSNAKQNWIVTLQANIRSRLKKGQAPAQIQAELGAAKMGVAVAKVAADPKMSAIAYAQSLTPEQRKEFIASLMAGK